MLFDLVEAQIVAKTLKRDNNSRLIVLAIRKRRTKPESLVHVEESSIVRLDLYRAGTFISPEYTTLVIGKTLDPAWHNLLRMILAIFDNHISTYELWITLCDKFTLLVSPVTLVSV